MDVQEGSLRKKNFACDIPVEVIEDFHCSHFQTFAAFHEVELKVYVDTLKIGGHR
jgi:hypothetical protein